MFSSMNIIHLASPYLESLNLKIGETVNLSMRENDHAIMIYKLEPTTGMLRPGLHQAHLSDGRCADIKRRLHRRHYPSLT